MYRNFIFSFAHYSFYMTFILANIFDEENYFSNIYEWIAQNPEICQVPKDLPYEFVRFLNTSEGKTCDICPKEYKKTSKMACAEVVMKTTGLQFVCHEIPLSCSIGFESEYANFISSMNPSTTPGYYYYTLENAIRNDTIFKLNQRVVYSNNESFDKDKSVQYLTKQMDNNFGNSESKIRKNDDDCFDENRACCFWAVMGECNQNPSYMGSVCPLSCGLCGCQKSQKCSYANEICAKVLLFQTNFTNSNALGPLSQAMTETSRIINFSNNTRKIQSKPARTGMIKKMSIRRKGSLTSKDAISPLKSVPKKEILKKNSNKDLNPKNRPIGYWINGDENPSVYNPNYVPISVPKPLDLALPITEELEREFIKDPYIRRLLQKMLRSERNGTLTTTLNPYSTTTSTEEFPFVETAKTTFEKIGHYALFTTKPEVKQSRILSPLSELSLPQLFVTLTTTTSKPKFTTTTKRSQFHEIENSSAFREDLIFPLLEEPHENCFNYHNLCKFWADNNECVLNPFWMKANCQKACNTCGEDHLLDHLFVPEKRNDCHNYHKLCPFWWFYGECSNNPIWMQKNCQLSCVCMYKMPGDDNRSKFNKSDFESQIFIKK